MHIWVLERCVKRLCDQDKFMSECRSLTNICGNAVAAVVIARMEGELDRATFNAAIRGEQKGLYRHWVALSQPFKPCFCAIAMGTRYPASSWVAKVMQRIPARMLVQTVQADHRV